MGTKIGCKRDPLAKVYRLMPKCECGESFSKHPVPRCQGYTPLKSLKQSAFKRKSGTLRKVSKKKARVMRKQKGIREEMLALQHRLYGTTRCELKIGNPWRYKSQCEGKLVLEHCESWRDQEKVNPAKLQIACERHNLEKGSRSEDCRPAEMVKECREWAKTLGFECP